MSLFWSKRKRGEIFGDWRRSLKNLSRILRSLGFGLGLKTFANLRRVSVSDSENLVSEKISVLVS